MCSLGSPFLEKTDMISWREQNNEFILNKLRYKLAWKFTRSLPLLTYFYFYCFRSETLKKGSSSYFDGKQTEQTSEVDCELNNLKSESKEYSCSQYSPISKSDTLSQ